MGWEEVYLLKGVGNVKVGGTTMLDSAWWMYKV